MSDRHMHITSFLYDSQEKIGEFIAAAKRMPFFEQVQPIWRRPGDIIAVAFYTKDLNGFDDEAMMPEVTEALSGILLHKVDLVSAWEGGSTDRVMVQEILPGCPDTLPPNWGEGGGTTTTLLQ